MMTPDKIRTQIAHLKRCQSELMRCYTIAYYAQDDLACHEIRVEYRLISGLIDSLCNELIAPVELRRAQREAIEEAMRIVAIGY